MKKLLALLALLILSCQSDQEAPIIYYDLNVIINPTEAGRVTPFDGQFQEGQTITLNVSAKPNYVFSSWSGGASGSDNPLSLVMDSNKSITAQFILADDDGDGVTNTLDLCSGTPTGEVVDENGCAVSQVDTDGDGVTDVNDQDNNTRAGVPVDENGVMLNPIYLDENGLTIKAYNWSVGGDVGVLNGVEYTVVNGAQLADKIANEEDLTRVCTSKITSMEALFRGSTTFNQPIGHWDLANVTSMASMFEDATIFNQDISQWNTVNVIDMSQLFDGALAFDQPIGAWNTANVEDMGQLFDGATSFNQDLNLWNTSGVRFMNSMFSGASVFNQPVDNWNTSNVIRMSTMFSEPSLLNQP